MPTYLIETSRGSFEVEANREPTAEEAATLVEAKISPQQQPSTPTGTPAAPPPPPTSNSVRSPTPPSRRAFDPMVDDRFARDRAIRTSPGGAQKIAELHARPEEIFADRQRRANTPQVAAMASLPFTGGATLPAILARAAIGGGARAASNSLEGKPAMSGSVARDAILFGAPVPMPSAGGVVSPAALANFAKGAGSGAVSTSAAKYAESAIDKQTLLPYDSYKDAFSDVLLPSMIQGAALTVSGKLLGNAKLQAEADEGANAMRALGAENPALGDAIPKFSAMQERAAQLNPAIAAKIAVSRSPISKAFYQMLGNVPSNEEIASRIQPLIGKIDEAEAAYVKAQETAARAAQAAAAAKANTMLPVQERSRILQQATADELNSVSAVARAQIQQQIVADAIGTQTGRAEALKGVVSHLYKARSNAANSMMEATGIDPVDPIFDKGLLLSTAKKAMGDRAESPAGRAILDAIAKAKQPAVPEAAISRPGSQAMGALSIDDSRAFINAMNGGSDARPAALSLSEFRSLRDKISDGFSGLPENTLNSAENLASRVYGALGDAIKPSIATKYGQEAVAKYNQFLGFWRTTSQLRDSPFGRALLRGDVTDETVTAFANNLASGKIDETLNFKRFVDTVAQQNKEAAAMAYNTLRSAVKNSLLQNATDASGVVDYKKLSQSLQAIASKKDMPFNIDDFGLGTRQDIAGWNKVLTSFKPEHLSPTDIQAVMESPQVQQQLLGRTPDMASRLKTILAGKAFNKRILDAAALAEIGATKSQQSAYNEALTLAKQAGMNAEQAKQAVVAAQKNPLLSAFRGKGGYELTNEAGKLTGPGTLTDLVANMRRDEAAAMMGAMRTSKPQLAELVERRILAGELAKFMAIEQEIPGSLYKLDIPKLRAYFNPPDVLRANSEIEKLRSVLGKEKVAKFETFMRNLSKLDDQTRGAVLSTAGHSPISDAVGVATAVSSGGAMGRAYAKRNAIQWMVDWMKARRFNMLSAALLDDGWMNAINRSSGDIGEALSSLPMQKAYLLLNDKGFQRDLGSGSADSDKPKQEIPKTATESIAPQAQYKEGKIYRDPTTGIRKRFVNGQWAEVA